MLDFLSGTRRARPGVAPVPPDALRAALLSVNRPTAPFVIRPCTAADRERADLVAEWRLAEPAWLAVFGSGEATRIRIYMRLVPERHEVRSIDRVSETSWSIGRILDHVSWSDGGLRLSLRASSSRGQVSQFRFGTTPFVETTANGQQLRFSFSTSELKNPLRDAVTAAGWTWRGALWSL